MTTSNLAHVDTASAFTIKLRFPGEALRFPFLQRSIHMSRLFLSFVLMVALTGVMSAAEVVKYKCPKWKTKHIHNTKQAAQIASTLKKLKCEVEKNQHNGHIDLKYRCEKQMQIELKTHEEAEKWLKWFKEFGFETEHSH